MKWRRHIIDIVRRAGRQPISLIHSMTVKPNYFGAYRNGRNARLNYGEWPLPVIHSRDLASLLIVLRRERRRRARR